MFRIRTIRRENWSLILIELDAIKFNYEHWLEEYNFAAFGAQPAHDDPPIITLVET